ncbi:general transcription factor 3C polypeptide 5 isoform X2 [Selaginella moellendorffii]|uniref:general transcription factor 3C polypeptide 5 isoform X2 n=1 Tax=Selaginella moellendorffii TaxID=88036 RepID=UPI000D1C79A0|nr:general transcription factor 3C polypeptide 5 isoform X2 [Selaginella moellendorffii]|eukprot:XP_024544941.1 general transcription factor 3C polypeptide 5 isoform X2 [Selaginella moellendorffii]
MAPVVKGSVSGVLPERRVFAVQYPGYPSSIDRAVETLGGEAGIAKVRASDAGYLELKFRPEDPYSHPAFGEPHRTSDLLLRISAPKQGDERNSADSRELDAEIIAHVEDSYVFDGMADYQYVLAVHSNGSSEKKSKQTKQRFGSLMDMEEEDLMILVPPLFSIKDMPEETLLRPSDRSKAKPVENPMDFTPCFGLDFKAKDVPKAVNWEVKLVKDSEEWSLHKAMVKCFEERPIWVKTTLVQKLHDQGLEPTPSMLKRLLFRLAYNFLYGPFRTLWIKNGYDPRKDPASRKYQMLDFRVPRLLRYSVQQAPRREAENTFWRDECAFKVVPQKKFSFFQLYDLQDDFIKSQIEKPPERNTCSESTGWFRRGTLERMRQHVRLRFLALIPGDAARALEETETKNFERFKNKAGWRGGNRGALRHIDKSIDTMDDPGLFPEPLFAEGDIAETPHGSETTNAGKQPEVLTGDDDEDDEEEEEDDEARADEEDEEDEESEEDEDNLQNKSKPQTFPSEVPTHPSHDIPKNYLQALLEKFPQGQKAGETDEDTEYTIYEQEEDDEGTF